MALILLLTNTTTKVHLVFDSERFRKRDHKEFACWWEMHDFINNVEHHTGLDFEVKSGDVILVDESDNIIFSNHAKFVEKVQSNRCICVSATPDNDNKKGVEREILNKSAFKFINGWPECIPLPTAADVSCIQSLPFAPDSKLLQHILNVLKDCSILLYCSLEFQQLLVTFNVSFTLI